jgi:hypothetical protein
MLRVLGFLSLVSLSSARDEAVVLVVDPAWDDTAGYVKHIPLISEFKVVKVMMRSGPSHSFVPAPPITPYRTFTFDSPVPEPTAASEQICPQLKSMDIPIAAIIPTSDPTVSLTDLLAECTGVRGNPASGPLAKARRNKWIMGEAVSKAGLRTMKEKVVSSWHEAQAYLQTWQPPLSTANPCVFKILKGSGGAGTYKVSGMKQAKAIFDEVHGSVDATADVNSQILIQEYLVGREYAVDSVSRDGVHKVVAVWFEDFREANGVFDQYFGFKLMDPNDELTKKIVKYGTGILDATGLRNGAANTEIKILENDDDAPCLMEINARWAGINWGDGLTVEENCVGMDQIEATFKSYLDQDAFDAMPAVRPLSQHGAVVFGVNLRAGILKSIPGFEAVKKMPSYLSSDIDSAAGIAGMLGKELALTSPTAIPLAIGLAHADSSVVDADYDRIIDMENANVFFDTRPAQHPWLGTTSFLSAGYHAHTQRSLPTALAYILAGLVGMSAWILFAIFSSKRQVRDDTMYLAIE